MMLCTDDTQPYIDHPVQNRFLREIQYSPYTQSSIPETLLVSIQTLSCRHWLCFNGGQLSTLFVQVARERARLGYDRRGYTSYDWISSR